MLAEEAFEVSVSVPLVLEVAVEAQCRYIVTFNTRDFAGVEQFGIQTLTPGEFLALLQEDA